MHDEILTEQNFLLYAAKHYDNPQCVDMLEFYDDVKRFKYLKRLFAKYAEQGELKERLILNHIILLYNMFGEHATRMLFLKLHNHYSQLKPFLLMIGRMPDRIVMGPGVVIRNSDIPLDDNIVKALREI